MNIASLQRLSVTLIASGILAFAAETALSHSETSAPSPSPQNKASVWIAEQPRLTAGSLDFDGRTNSLTLTEVRITTQNGYVIQAGEAETGDASNFNNSRWVFKNKVEITTPQGRSSSEVANVSFAQNQISELHMTGSPATFEQYDAAKQTIARGQAGAIDYDLKQNTVRLSNDAWLKYGQNECRAVALSYNIGAQRVSARTEEQQGQRVNCTINPNPGDTNAGDSSANTGATAGSSTP